MELLTKVEEWMGIGCYLLLNRIKVDEKWSKTLIRLSKTEV